MGIRRYNPTSPGRRGATVSDFADLTPGAKPEKSLLRPKRRTGGRNNQGKTTVRFRGGGHKRAYRLIDFRRNKDGVPARVDSIQYDPNRTARIAPVALRRRREALHPGPRGPEGGRPGSQRRRRPRPRSATACRWPRSRPAWTSTTSRCSRAAAACLCRSAGGHATLAARDADWAQINLPSGEIRRVPATCRATDRRAWATPTT